MSHSVTQKYQHIDYIYGHHMVLLYITYFRTNFLLLVPLEFVVWAFIFERASRQNKWLLTHLEKLHIFSLVCFLQLGVIFKS